MTTDTSSVPTSGRQRLARSRPWSVLLLGLVCLTCSGCLAPLMFFGLLIGGPPSIEPDFDRQTKISLDEKDRKVVVLCYAPKEVKFDFDNVDREVSVYVARQLAANKINVVDPNLVVAWLDEHADEWDKPEEIGRDLEADFVIFLEVSSFSLYEEGSNTLYRGNSETLISVYEMEQGDGNEIYTKELLSKFPILQGVSTSDMSYYDFKRMYLTRLSDEIGRHFYAHYAADEVANSAINQ